MQRSRRKFIGRSLAAATAISLAKSPLNTTARAASPQQPTPQQPATAGEAEAQPDVTAGWIDAHVHIWSPDTTRYPLAPGFTPAEMQPPSFTPQELFAHCRPAGVSRIVLIQMSFYLYDHTYLIEAIKQHPGVFSGVALIDHHDDQLVTRIKSLAADGIRGFRLHSRGDAHSWVNDPGIGQLFRTAAAEGLAVCPLINPSDIGFVDQLCQQYPETHVVVDHFARIGLSGKVETDYLQQLCKLARFPHTYVKTSAFYALGKKQPPYDDLIPMIRQVCDRFGPQRLMWASDCPFQVQGEHSYEASLALIRDRIDFLTPAEKQQLLRGTADKLFFA